MGVEGRWHTNITRNEPVYWAENDELIPEGEKHQGGMLAKMIRSFQPKAFEEVRHAQGHGYPFFRVDVVNKQIVTFSRGPFLESVKKMLSYARPRPKAGAPRR